MFLAEKDCHRCFALFSWFSFSLLFLRSEGCSFYFGSLGLGPFRSMLLLCPQPCAARPCGDPMAVPMRSAAKVVTFGGFNRRATSFRVARGTLWHSNFITCHKSFCVTGAIICVIFRKAGPALWWPPWSFCVARAALFANRIVRAASRGDSVQIPWQAWDVVRVSFYVEAHYLVKIRRVSWQLQYLGHATLYTPHSALC